MTLGQFATAVGADKRWVQNAFRVLGVEGGYTVENAKRMAFARTVKETAGLPLKEGFPLADEALARWPHEPTWSLTGAGGVVHVTLDLERFLSDFHIRLSLARCWYAEKKRGRPRREKDDGVEVARAYGVDMSLLEWSLARSPQQRLRALDEEVESLRPLGAETP